MSLTLKAKQQIDKSINPFINKIPCILQFIVDTYNNYKQQTCQQLQQYKFPKSYQINKQQLMTASADKVQYILEAALEQTIPLVKKGLLTEGQLRNIMINREKHQNLMYSAHFKLSHFLKAIQYQYGIERLRLSRLKEGTSVNTNPLFKKQSNTDFAIVKRLIKLWDKTMHKYKYRPYLWKQYLEFCIAIKSKKHFYKALTQGLKFLPFELDLWKIGVRYEVQVGLNMWKARKLFYKALRLVPKGNKSIQLTKQLIKFQLQFVQKLHLRQKIIEQGSQQENGQVRNIKFIMPNEHQHKQEVNDNDDLQEQSQHRRDLGQSDMLNLKDYHQVLFVALVESIQQNSLMNKLKKTIKQQQEQEGKNNNNMYQQQQVYVSTEKKAVELCHMYLQFLKELISEENQAQTQTSELLCSIIKAAYFKLKQYSQQGVFNTLEGRGGIKKEQMQQQGQLDNNNHQDLVIEEEPQQVMIEEESIELENKHHNNSNKALKFKKDTADTRASQVLANCYKNKQFDQKIFTKSIKQFCLKPQQLSQLLQQVMQVYYQQSMSILCKNQWLKLPLTSLSNILKKFSSEGLQKTNSVSSVIGKQYLRKQIAKVNPLDYCQNIQSLKAVIQFNNKIMGDQTENNRLFRSILVNGKKNPEFIEVVRSLFIQV